MPLAENALILGPSQIALIRNALQFHYEATGGLSGDQILEENLANLMTQFDRVAPPDSQVSLVPQPLSQLVAAIDERPHRPPVQTANYGNNNEHT